MKNDYAIVVRDVRKSFKTYRSLTGQKVAFASLRRKKVTKRALQGVSFTIRKGEIVALLGLNGSGKSTLVKIIIGILYPDEGSTFIMGHDSWTERNKFASRMGVVLGAHGQLYWDLPALDTFNLMKHIYKIPDKVFKERVSYFVKRLNLKDVYKRQVRQLSLGEQMKCNFVASVLHMPDIVLLDEPTIGVDLPSKSALRETIKDMQRRYNTTFLLTTHIVEDITIAERIVILDKGRVIFQGSQERLLKLFGDNRTVELSFENMPGNEYRRFGRVLAETPDYAKIEVKSSVLKDKRFIDFLSRKEVVDYNVLGPELSNVLMKLYRSRNGRRSHG